MLALLQTVIYYTYNWKSYLDQTYKFLLGPHFFVFFFQTSLPFFFLLFLYSPFISIFFFIIIFCSFYILLKLLHLLLCFLLKQREFLGFFHVLIQHCIICCPSDSTVSDDAASNLELFRLWNWQSDALITSLGLIQFFIISLPFLLPCIQYCESHKLTSRSLAKSFCTPPPSSLPPRKKHNFSNFDLHYCAGMHIKPTLCTSRKLSLVGAPHRESAGTYVFLKVVNCLFKG